MTGVVMVKEDRCTIGGILPVSIADTVRYRQL